MSLLELRDVSKHFGAIRALNGVTLSLEPGQVSGSWETTAPGNRRW